MTQFIGFREFVKHRHEIKKAYFQMSFKDKKAYKWYIYANSLIDDDNKDLIWEYLNNDISNTKLKSGRARV